MKFFKYLLFVTFSFLVALSSVNSCEAKTLAVCPLINKVSDRSDYEQMYYSCVFDVLKSVNSYELMDDNKIDELVEENLANKALPTREQCRTICNKSGVEMFFALMVDKHELKERNGQQDSKMDMLLVGKAICYDAASDKYVVLTLNDEEFQDSSLMARYDIAAAHFSNNVRRIFKRALNIKKVTFEKPRLGI